MGPSRRALFALVAAAFFAPRVAFSQANYQPFPLGERGFGMGGAYTALAEEATGAWYNPAGAVFANASGVTVSTSLYGLTGGSFAGSFGPALDYSYRAVNVVPSAVGALLRLGAARPDGSARFAAALHLFSPTYNAIDRRVDLRDGRTTLFVTQSDRTLTPGGSFAWRVSDRVALGASVHTSVHLLVDRVDLSDYPGTAPVEASPFVQFTSGLDALGLSLFASLGARFELGRGFSLGLSARSPAAWLYGESSFFQRTVRSVPAMPALVEVRSGALDARRIQPARLSAGVAWSLPERVTVAIDGSVYLPVRYTAVELGGGPVEVREQSLSTVVNGAAGVEWTAHRRFLLRGGFFTDISAAAPPTAAASRLDQLHQLGATLTGTLRTAVSTTTVGVLASYGFARVLGIDVASASYSAFPVDGAVWRLYLVLSGTAG